MTLQYVVYAAFKIWKEKKYENVNKRFVRQTDIYKRVLQSQIYQTFCLPREMNHGVKTFTLKCFIYLHFLGKKSQFLCKFSNVHICFFHVDNLCEEKKPNTIYKLKMSEDGDNCSEN